MLKRGLVLSGGGANGAYQVGVLDHLISRRGYDFDVLCGTSVGALNAAYLAQFESLKIGIGHLKTLWCNIKGDSDIYEPWAPLGGVLAGFLHSSWYDSKPLWKFVDDHFSIPKLQEACKKKNRQLIVGAISYRTGQLRRWTESSPDIKKAILASSAFPAFFCPIEIDGDIWTDAGLREVVPVEDAVKAEAKDLLIITCSPPEYLDPMSKDPKSFELSRRCIDIMSNEVVKNDLWRCRNKGIAAVQVSPRTSLGDSLDFSHDKIFRLIEQGLQDAERLFPPPPTSPVV